MSSHLTVTGILLINWPSEKCTLIRKLFRLKPFRWSLVTSSFFTGADQDVLTLGEAKCCCRIIGYVALEKYGILLGYTNCLKYMISQKPLKLQKVKTLMKEVRLQACFWGMTNTSPVIKSKSLNIFPSLRNWNHKSTSIYDVLQYVYEIGLYNFR